MRSLLAATTFIQQTAAIDHKQFIIKHSCVLLCTQNISQLKIAEQIVILRKNSWHPKSRAYAHKYVNPLISILSDLFLAMKKNEYNYNKFSSRELP